MGGIQALNPAWVELVVGTLPLPIKQLLRAFPRNVFIAGGFVRDAIAQKDWKDIDLFVTASIYQTRVEAWLKTRCNVVNEFESEKADSFDIEDPAGNYTVQLITRTVLDIDGTLRTFDLTICQGAVFFDGTRYVGVATDDFLTDVPLGIMRYIGDDAENPSGTILRVIRFAQRGWMIDQMDLSRILARHFERIQASVAHTPDIPLEEHIRNGFFAASYAKLIA